MTTAIPEPAGDPSRVISSGDSPIPITHLVSAIGKWDLRSPERPTYQAPQPDFDKPFGICVSDVYFAEGEARVTVNIPHITKDSGASGRFLIGYRAPNVEYFLVGLGGPAAYTLYQYESEIGWRPILLCGHVDNLVPNKEYNISVHVRGQRLVFKKDDVPVFEYLFKSPLPLGQLGLFTWGSDPVEFTNFCVRQERGKAFVIMQFAEPYLSLYNEVIKEVAESGRFKLKASHAGEGVGRIILEDIVRGIEEARVVIAEITPANKNVFYEVGYAHALHKPTILLVDEGAVGDLPFDLKVRRCIPYENTIVGKSHVQKELEKHLESILFPQNSGG